MAWRTYTPDGRTLDVDHLDNGSWFASCESGSAVASTPAEAIREALGSERAIGSNPGLLAAWIAERAAQYERESSV